MLLPVALPSLPPELLALGTAVCTGLAGVLTAEVSGRISVWTITRWVMLVSTALMVVLATLTDGWVTLTDDSIRNLALSGAFSTLIAGPAYYGSINLLGARRSALVFSLYAPFGAVLGYVMLGEEIAPRGIAGIALVLAGIALAVLFGSARPDDDHGKGRRSATAAPAETVEDGAAMAWWTSPLVLGLACGLIAALGQAAGNLAARPAMANGADPFAAMAIRGGLSSAVFVLLSLTGIERRGGPYKKSWRAFAIVALASIIGMGIGMTMLMAAFAEGDLGLMSTLAATTPIAVLPMLWLRTGHAPSWRAWAGALLAVAGSALIFGAV